jgi:hypothetical protein
MHRISPKRIHWPQCGFGQRWWLMSSRNSFIGRGGLRVHITPHSQLRFLQESGRHISGTTCPATHFQGTTCIQIYVQNAEQACVERQILADSHTRLAERGCRQERPCMVRMGRSGNSRLLPQMGGGLIANPDHFFCRDPVKWCLSFVRVVAVIGYRHLWL